jgi:hypothetical protein
LLQHGAVERARLAGLAFAEESYELGPGADAEFAVDAAEVGLDGFGAEKLRAGLRVDSARTEGRDDSNHDTRRPLVASLKGDGKALQVDCKCAERLPDHHAAHMRGEHLQGEARAMAISFPAPESVTEPRTERGISDGVTVRSLVVGATGVLRRGYERACSAIFDADGDVMGL